MNCRECGTEFEPTENKRLKSDFICPVCQKEYNKRYREKRKALGLSVSGSRSPADYHRQYAKTYYQNEAHRQRRAELAKKRRKDPTERQKHLARWVTNRAIASGRLVKHPCEACGEPKVDAHHDDYTKPLEIRWLCRQCHRNLHAAKAKGGS